MYKYSTRSPRRDHRSNRDVLTGHVQGEKIRRDVVKPNSQQRQPYCLCGWRYAGWVGSVRLSNAEYDKHLVEASKQRSMFDVADPSWLSHLCPD